MGNSAINFIALLVAIVVGYGVLMSSHDSDEETVPNAPVLEGYYLKNALITETTDEGKPRFGLSATEVLQNANDNSVQLSTVKVDYLAAATSDSPFTKWTMTAAHGELPSKSDVVTLTGNVIARTVDAVRNVVLKTALLKVNTKEQTAQTDHAVAIDVGTHRVTGQGMTADLPHDRVRVAGRGELRLAEVANPSNDEKKISLPDIFEHEGVELRDGGVRLKKVRSKTPPLVEADEAVAGSTDLDNNRFTLRGNVHFELPQQGNLQADSAVVTIRDSRIVRAVATGQANGAPVRFEHRRKVEDKETHETTLETAHGQAQTIDYEVQSGILNFTGDVSFSTPRVKWHGEDWQYNLNDGSGSSNKRSTTIVHPREGANKNLKP